MTRASPFRWTTSGVSLHWDCPVQEILFPKRNGLFDIRRKTISCPTSSAWLRFHSTSWFRSCPARPSHRPPLSQSSTSLVQPPLTRTALLFMLNCFNCAASIASICSPDWIVSGSLSAGRSIRPNIFGTNSFFSNWTASFSWRVNDWWLASRTTYMPNSLPIRGISTFSRTSSFWLLHHIILLMGYMGWWICPVSRNRS